MDKQPAKTTEEDLRQLRERFGASGKYEVPLETTNQAPYFMQSTGKQPPTRLDWFIILLRRFIRAIDRRS
jgi:hypothetical protein